MILNIVKSDTPLSLQKIEIVERKGVGHPDTLSDMIAEVFSYEYSRHCLEVFGKIPNHWVDKCLIKGGASDISYGAGTVVVPIEVMIFGKVTEKVGNQKIPLQEIAEKAARKVLCSALTVKDFDKAFVVKVHTVSSHGVGRPSSWYEPRSVDDIVDFPERTSNDAAICVGYGRSTAFEESLLAAELFIHGLGEGKFCTGTDVKLLGKKVHDQVSVEACIPLLADFTPSRKFYYETKEFLGRELKRFFEDRLGLNTIVSLNTRDVDDQIYMLAQGSAADTGDYGVVGRGNRFNGLITPLLPMSIEAVCGKNPLYHSGRIYSLVVDWLSREISQKYKLDCISSITTATGDKLTSPRSLNVVVHEDGESSLPTVQSKEIEEMTVQSILSFCEDHALQYEYVCKRSAFWCLR